VRDGAAGPVVEQPVAVNDAVVGVGEQRKIKAGLAFEFFAQELRLVGRVNADGEDFDAVAALRGDERFQLPELSGAVRSPVAAVEDEDDRLAPAVVRERDRF
jgi:hypothetical protein